MKKFITRLLIIIAITFVGDRGLSYVVRFFYNRTTTTDEFKINSVMFRMNEPVVFMGSSRCHHQYIPSIISDTLHKGVYNAGLWGMRNIYFQYAMLCNILQKYTPQTICYEIHPIDYLHIPISDIEKVGSLAPFINYSSGCDEMLKRDGIYYKCEISHLYRYNSQFANIIAGSFSDRSLVADMGVKIMNGLMDTAHGAIKPERFSDPIDYDKLHYLQAFIDTCKQRKINLIFLYSPMYAVEKTHLFDIPDSVAKKNGIPFLNHYNMEGFSGNKDMYYDYGHLNGTGAKKYSSIIASELKQYIK